MTLFLEIKVLLQKTAKTFKIRISVNAPASASKRTKLMHESLQMQDLGDTRGHCRLLVFWKIPAVESKLLDCGQNPSLASQLR